MVLFWDKNTELTKRIGSCRTQTKPSHPHSSDIDYGCKFMNMILLFSFLHTDAEKVICLVNSWLDTFVEQELVRREIGKRRGGGGISVVLVVLVGLLGLLVGYLMKKP